MRDFELKKEARVDAVEDIKKFFIAEKGEEISDFQASNLLDFFITSIGPYIYNQALSDAYQLMSEKVEDLYGLEKRRFRD